MFTREAAHMSLDEAVADFPADEINTKPPNLSYSFWHILEHIRIGQWDLLEYVQNPKRVARVAREILAARRYHDRRRRLECEC